MKAVFVQWQCAPGQTYAVADHLFEREVASARRPATSLKLALKNPDFTTANMIAGTINSAFAGTAEVLDPATVELKPGPGFPGSVVDLVARIENLPVTVDQPAKVIVNEASDTVVMGANVRISPVAIAQGGLTISVAETPQVSQPAPLSQGQTQVVPRTQVTVDDGTGRSLGTLGGETSLASLVAGLNALGVSPRDLITILQAVKSAGALQADIEVQ